MTALRINLSFQVTLLTNQGKLARVSSSAALSSMTNCTLGCTCRKVAGTESEILPSTVFLMIGALFSPQAIKITFRAFMIVPTPMVIARVGTLSIPPNSPEASFIVSSFRYTIRVLEVIVDPGSLKPMWPVRPMPNI